MEKLMKTTTRIRTSQKTSSRKRALAAQAHKRHLLTLSRINLTDRQLYDLELLLVGAFHPLTGFLKEEEYTTVLENMRLPSGELWPMPIVLDVEKPVAEVGEKIILCDKFGNPIALLSVESLYRADKGKEARMVYGTTDLEHPSVRYLYKEMGNLYVGGKVKKLQLPARYDFADLRHTPTELKKIFAKRGWKKIAAFQTRNPIHRAHFELMCRARAEYGTHILIHPVVGVTKEGDIDYITRVNSYRKLHQRYMRDFAILSLLPLAMRMAGPREALWHALIRKNYGVTHFIVGRDHAGPGNDKNGKPFYGPYDAQELVKKFEKEIGLTIIPQQEMVYVEEIKKYIPIHEVPGRGTIRSISGTLFRKKLLGKEEVPAWFSFPEVIEELRKGVEASRGGLTVFFTGLSGAGKSTIAHILYTKLLEEQDKKITFLDGDVIRSHLSKGLGFSREDRNANIERIGFVANEITKHGGIAICSAIAPYGESRERNRSLISKNGAYVEVFISTPLSVCVKRDPKGLYHKARKGLLPQFTGVDDPYEKPTAPEITIDASKINPVRAAFLILRYLQKHNLLSNF